MSLSLFLLFFFIHATYGRTPRRLSSASRVWSQKPNTCVSLGNACGNSASGLGQDCLFSGTLATTCSCNASSFDIKGEVKLSGTCALASTQNRSDAKFGAACSTFLSFRDCLGFEPWLSPATVTGSDDSAVFFPGSLVCGQSKKCGYGAVYDSSNSYSFPKSQGLNTGDPCTPEVGCGSSTHLNCSLAGPTSPNLMVCARSASDIGCSSVNSIWNDCPYGSYCSAGNTCVQYAELNAPCTCLSNSNTCAPGLACYVPGSSSGTSGSLCAVLENSANLPGVCIAEQSYSPGDTFFVAPGYSALAQSITAGGFLCSTGLAAPIPDAFGFPSTVSTCMSSWNWSSAGAICSNCTANAAGAYPLYGDGSLSCLPSTPSAAGGLCTVVPNYQSTAEAIASMITLSQCLRKAVSPAGTPCTPTRPWFTTDISPLEGTCAYYACYEQYAHAVALSSFPNPASAPFVSSPCLLANAHSLVDYASNSAVGCSLPAAFAAQGWMCRSTPPAANAGKATGLSKAAKISIAIGVVVIVLAGIIGGCFLYKRLRRGSSSKGTGSASLNSPGFYADASDEAFPKATPVQPTYVPPPRAATSAASSSASAGNSYKALTSDGPENPFS
jgi:hypothetical protein